MASNQVFTDIFDTFTGKNKAPDAPNAVALDSQTQAMLDDMVRREDNPGESSLELAKQTANSIVPSMNQLNQDSARSAQDPYFDQAALRIAQNKYGQREQGYNQQAGIQQDLQKSQQMAKAAQAALGLQKTKDQQYAFLTEAYNQQEAARAQFVNNIFQTGAYAMGAAGGAKGGGAATASSGPMAGGPNMGGGNPGSRANSPQTYMNS